MTAVRERMDTGYAIKLELTNICVSLCHFWWKSSHGLPWLAQIYSRLFIEK